jgi:hypothetical protein
VTAPRTKFIADAQDYASWVEQLTPYRVAQIFQRFSGGKSLDVAFQERFAVKLDEETPQPVAPKNHRGGGAGPVHRADHLLPESCSPDSLFGTDLPRAAVGELPLSVLGLNRSRGKRFAQPVGD